VTTDPPAEQNGDFVLRLFEPELVRRPFQSRVQADPSILLIASNLVPVREME
jgi:hypothetical protein